MSMNIPENKDSLRLVLNSFAKLLAWVWKVDRFSIFLSIIVALLMSFQTIFLILLPKLFVDSLLEGDSRKAISLLCVYVIVCTIFLVILSVSGYFFNILKLKRKYKVAGDMMFRTVDLQLEHVENGPFMDYYKRTFNTIQAATDSVVNIFGAFVHAVLNIIAVISILSWINTFLLALLIVVVLVDVLVNITTSKIAYSSEVSVQKEEKRLNSLSRIFFLPNSIREIKTLRFSSIVRAKFIETKENTIRTKQKFKKKELKLGFLSSFITELSPVMPMSYFGYCVITGSIDISSYFMYNNAYITLRQSLKSLMDAIPKIYSTGLYSKDYFEYMENSTISELKNVDGLEMDTIESIEFKAVSFRYKNSRVYALRNVSFSIKKGDKVAFIGKNGAGKTTIMKIMMGLYEPTEGTILVNGVDIKLYNLDSLRKNFGVLFQDFYLFPFTIRENLMLDDCNEPEAKELLAKFGLDKKVDSLKSGLDTGISPQFCDDFTNFSGGETQKLAIIRLILQTQNSCIVLDEPTSNLDPESEYILYKSILSEITSDKIVIAISHRLVMTTKMDRIFVVDNGGIAECGTHHELISSGGLYADMFSIQSEKYDISLEA